MTPQELLIRRAASAKQVDEWAFEFMSPASGAMGTGYEYRHEYASLIATAVPFWWEDKILSLALASPLPPNTKAPEPPYDACWFAFKGTDDDGWGYVLVGRNFSPFMITPHDALVKRFGSWNEPEIWQRLLIFLASPYVTTERRRPHNKAAARRAGNQAVHFVTLRQPKHNHKQGDSQPFNWKSRWLVRGHYRNQWYPSLSEHRTIWIGSYIKGPEDKPLREPVYRVVR